MELTGPKSANTKKKSVPLTKEKESYTPLSRMKISHKIVFSNVFYLIPMGIMLFISLIGIRYDIRFSDLEIYGNEYQRPLEMLLKSLPEHMRYSLTEKGLKEQTRLSESEKEINTAFRSLSAVQEKRGEDLQFTPEGLKIRERGQLVPALLEERWEKIREGNLSENQLREEYLSLIKDIRLMITHSGDTSNLILDPDLDSYYLMDLSLLVLPQTQDRLGEILLFGTEVLQEAEKNRENAGQKGDENRDDKNDDKDDEKQDKLPLSDDARLKFYVYAKMLEESDLSRIQGSTHTALNEDQNFYGIYSPLQNKIPASYGKYEKPTKEFIAMLYDLGTSKELNYSSEQFVRLGEEARAQSFDYWYSVVGVLDDLLEIRIKSHERRFVRYLLIALIASGFSTIVFFAIRKNILGSIKCLEKGFKQSSANDLTTRIDVKTKDEIGQCSRDFNILLEKFSSLMKKLQKMTSVLTESVQNLNVTSQQVFTTSNEQAASVKEIVSTMEDSDTLSKSIAQNISEISDLSSHTTESVHDGFTLLTDLIGKMNEIEQANADTITGIRTLGEKIEAVWEIVSIINSIADQTKIIAFNAELEASAAGDAGKNFQIVASEIRRLANSTVSSTSEIKSKITEIQHSSDRLITASEESTRQINEGNDLTARMNGVFEGIMDSTGKTSTSTESISGTINHQVASFEQILLTLKQISTGIDSFVDATKASVNSAEVLKEMAEDLDESIEIYRVDDSDKGFDNQ